MSRATVYQVKNFPFSSIEVGGALYVARKQNVGYNKFPCDDATLSKIMVWLNNYVRSELPDIKRGDILSLDSNIKAKTIHLIWDGETVEFLKAFFGNEYTVPESYVWSDHDEKGCIVGNPSYWQGACSSVSWPSTSVRQKIADALVYLDGNHYVSTLVIEGITYSFSFDYEDHDGFSLEQVKALFLDPNNPLALAVDDDDTQYKILMV
jgi:hypothetical protein